jgi:hypothetical protein
VSWKDDPDLLLAPTAPGARSAMFVINGAAPGPAQAKM